jgi:hypothetical protein
MNSRSRKYHESRKAAKGNKKDSSPRAISVEKKEQTRENSVPIKEPGRTGSQENSASQDDTGGGNDSGKRIDEN